MIKMELRDISLSYNNVSALDGVSLDLVRGEIHAMVGEHGAGKSSVAHIMAGFQKKGGGRIFWEGRDIEFQSHQQAMKAGIRIVSQHNPLHENLSVGENLLLGSKAGIFPLISRKGIQKKAAAYMDKMGFSLDLQLPLADLPLSDRALVDILKHLYHNPSLLILDETLEKLSSENLQKILRIIRKRTKAGMTVLFISHRVDDIYNLADRVTIIRDGKDLLTEKIDHIDKMNLIRLAYTHALDDKKLQTKEAFNEILKYNEAILTDLPVSLFVTDRDGLLRMCNKSAERLMDSPIRGEKLTDQIGGDNRDFYNLVQDQSGGGENRTYYRIPFSCAGENRIFNVTVYPIMERAALLGNIFILVDITEQESLREQITLSENLASLGLLVAGVAHEINNPLNIMGYYLENLRFSSLSEEQKSTLDQIEEEIESVAQIVANLISFSNRNSVETGAFDLNELIDILVELLRYKAEEINIRIQWNRFEGPLMIKADRNEIRQVLLNLTHNAFDAMERGGILTISLRQEEKEALLELTDTGVGIPEEKLKDIFLPFYSTKAATGKNMGLGLSLSYRIVQKHSGSLSIFNRREGGCRAILTLPVSGG